MENQGSEVTYNLPKWKSHKIVWGFKIAEIFPITGGDLQGGAVLRSSPQDGSYEMTVDQAYMDRHHPEIDGYFVLYKDGYMSWSPAEAFEEGYTRV